MTSQEIRNENRKTKIIMFGTLYGVILIISLLIYKFVKNDNVKWYGIPSLWIFAFIMHYVLTLGNRIK